jgi:prepilin signal peptidase PulO-like enzyme (type II secretory pathway)
MLSHGADLPACALLATAQGLTVGLSGPRSLCGDGRRCPGWLPVAAVPVTFVAMVGLLATDPGAANTVARVAFVAIPLLAAFALVQLARRPACAAAVLPLLEIAVVRRNDLGGQVATLVLLTLSCVAIGLLVVRIGSGRALVGGVALLALADVILVRAGIVPEASSALMDADLGPLPSFSQAVIGTFSMGYGDLVVAAIAGAVAARRPGAPWRVGALTLVLVLIEGALLSDRGPYPATVPVVLALALDELWRVGRRRRPAAAAAA